MAQDIYGRTVEFGGAFASDRVTISFSGVAAGLLAQSVSTDYAQNINRIWELGSKKTYFVGGRTSGNFSMSSLSGPGGLSTTFIKRYGDLCQMANNNITLSYGGGWCAGGSGTSSQYVLNQLVVQQIQAQVQASEMMLNEAVSGMFNFLSA